MGFLDKIPGFGGLFGGSEVEVSLDEAFELFEQRTQEERDTAERGVRELQGELRELFGELEDVVEGLKSSCASEEMGKTSERVKDDYCRKLENILEGYSLDDLDDLEEVIGKMSPSRKQVGHIQGYFGEELREIRNKISEIRDKVGEIREAKEVLEDYQEVERWMNQLTETKKHIKELEREIQELKKEINSSKDRVGGLENEVMDFVVEPDPELKKKLRDKRDELGGLENELVSLLGVLKRVLRKYTYTTGREVEYADEPHKIALEDPERLNSLVDKIIDLDSSGEIDVDNKKITRVHKIQEKQQEIKDKVHRHRETKKEIRELEKRIKESLEPQKDEKNKLKRQLEEEKNRLREKQRELEKKQKEHQKLEERESRLESKIKETIDGYLKEKLIYKES
ncbi:hypothetical protein [Methanonatronarchaeum sp. AMET6-2]|uniref:hypothetical protein n=1 Tax=Methanonatronarchaeum sp. AMET6-2 TaxID=2933293 RepID=UPI001FF3FF69|nr:hypothetical protein [Methanonatronarchaeum sp. AMET6-2]UOY10265.1 hypothetical protein MU439_01135 [Methanonatronarchaeum sp. AMET6-2]